MKVSPKVVELFLLSSGAPPAIVELFRAFQAQGMTAFTKKAMMPDDPAWAQLDPAPGTSKSGIWLRAEGPNSRMTAAIFVEGVNDDALKILAHMDAVPALADGSGL